MTLGALTEDAFLGGKLSINQPKKGFRAGIDSVFLAAATPVQPHQTVLELGCGAGVASLCLAARVPDLALTGVEIQAEYAELARNNATKNNKELSVVTADLRALPDELRQQRFDHVIANPPYFVRTAGTAAADAGRSVALAGDTPINDWLKIAARRLAPKGHLTLIQRIERLPEVITALSGRLGSLTVLPISARTDRAPHLFILQAKHAGRAAFRLSPVLVMHQGNAHGGDRDSYVPLVRDILRSGAALPIWR